MIVEGLISFILVAALFYVSPGVLSAVQAAAPSVNSTSNPALAASQTAINSTVAGGLNLAAITLIMIGIGLMIAGFMIVRGGGGQPR
jgi:hypothetical protein